MSQKEKNRFINLIGGGSKLIKKSYRQKTSRARAFLFCVIFFVFLPVGFGGVSEAEANTYYVDGAIGDDNTGTGAQAQPWKTLIKAETAAANGDTVNVKSGTYAEASTVGGSSSNITFTKAIAWIGRGSDWVNNGDVRLQGKTSSVYTVIAGNTNAISFSNFIFDAQAARSYNVYVKAGQANKTFINCTFENSASVGYLLMIESGGLVSFNDCSFDYINGGSGSYVFNTNSEIVLNDSHITKVGGGVIGTQSNVTLNSTDIAVSNPTNNIFSQSLASGTLTIDGGSISISGGSGSHIISWAGNITLNHLTADADMTSGSFLYNTGTDAVTTINDLTADISTTSGSFLYSAGISATAAITASHITHTMSSSGATGFYSLSNSLAVQNSTVIGTGGQFLFKTTSSITLDTNAINYTPSFTSSYLVYNYGTGSFTVNNNTVAILQSTGNMATVFSRAPLNRADTGEFNFNHNVLTIDGLFDRAIGASNTSCGLTISSNTVSSSSLAVDGSFIIHLADIVNPVITDNIINTQSTGNVEHISITPSDVTNWLGTGLATISGNISYTKSHGGHVIALGQDSSSGPAYEQKWNGSIIENNTIYGPAYFGDNGKYNTHDIFIGHSIKCFVRNNKIIGGSLALVIKGLGLDWENQGGLYGNVIINSTYGAILSKGAINLNIYNNTVYINPTNYPNYAVAIGEGLSAYPTTGNDLYNNIIYSYSANFIAGLNHLIRVDAFSTIGFRSHGNIYWNELGNLTQQFFKFNNEYTGFDAWNSAIGGTDDSTLADPRFTDISANNAVPLYSSPAIDSGIPVSGLTTDYLGNHIYGMPDIGAYEYQPPYTIGTDDINVSSPVRIYADGKYRYTNETSGGSDADLTVIPQGGFGTGDYGQWMDIDVDTWHTSADYYKKWTESSVDHDLVTSHTIGDLEPNTRYTLKINGQTTNTYVSNNQGHITFTYNGNCSIRIFEIEETSGGVLIIPSKPDVSDIEIASSGNGTIGIQNLPSNITQIAISRTPDFADVSWREFDAEKFVTIGDTAETLYVKFRTDQGAVSDVVVYAPKVANQSFIDGDIVKTANNPDVYIIKYRNNKKYKRLILSPSVFQSYGHLKWENLKTISQDRLDQFTASDLVKETMDAIIYQLFPNGDTGERKALDVAKSYDADSVYEINAVDRDSYKLVK